jgi:hypothetical protein
MMQGDSELFEVIHALRAPRRLARALNGRQQQCDKHADNGDDH